MTPRVWRVSAAWVALFWLAFVINPCDALTAAPKPAVEDRGNAQGSTNSAKSPVSKKGTKTAASRAQKRTPTLSPPSKAKAASEGTVRSAAARPSSGLSKTVVSSASAGPRRSGGPGGAATLKKAQERIPPAEPYKAAIVMDADSGEVLYEENPRRRLIPASLTKMMLTLVAVEELRSGRVRLDDRVRISEHASGVGGTQVNLKPGDSVSLEELLTAVLVRSANDAAVAVAEHVAGSHERCVQIMNQRARSLGMEDTVFHNVHGLPCGNGEENSSTVYDMALLARQLTRYPEVLQWSSQPVVRVHHEYYTSTNKLLGLYPGLDGLKTGYIKKSGFNMAATAERDGLRLIAVSMGSPTSQARFDAIQELLSKGFNYYQGKAERSVIPVAEGVTRGAQPKSASIHRFQHGSRTGAGS
jgi:D-alanyl-D-alanine carboxypeptidase